jgi:hypothetical protein
MDDLLMLANVVASITAKSLPVSGAEARQQGKILVDGSNKPPSFPCME